MNVKCWAAFFVYLLCSSYVGTAVAQMSMACRPNAMLDREVDRTFDNIRNQIQGQTFNLQDDTAGNMQMTGGKVTIKDCKVEKPIRCECNNQMIRLFLKVSFIDITVTFLVTLLDDLLGGLLGSLGSGLARLLGQVVNLLVRLLALEINVVIVVEQRLVPGATCTVTDFRVDRVSEISLLNIDLSPLLLGLLGGILKPVVEALLKNLLERQVRAIITAQIQKMRITPDMFTCG